MLEQLQYKAQVNIVKFGSRAASWRERLVEVSPPSLENAWSWVKGLQAAGSTNTMAALQLALADIDTQAVYLLTDGRPDQPTRTILAQVQLCPPVLVHTISFNCKDPEANHFLYQLAQETGGRYHCFPCGPQEPGAPTPYVSEDTHLLKAEIEKGKKELEKVLKLRAECMMLDWYHNGDSTTAKRTHGRPHSAPWWQSAERPRRPWSALGCVPASHPSHPTTQARSSQPRPTRHAAQTKASLLRLLSNGVGSSARGALQEWMLPETLSLFQANADKQKQVLSRLQLTPRDDSQKKPKRKTPTQSLSMSSACWLRTNSLVARRLTIIDALAPTAITQNAKFIPILEKHIYSKVFEEVFPLAHVSGSTGQLTLVNPHAVNLEHYKTRLQAALQDYQRRLDLIVWKALTQEERDKFGSDQPVRFQEHSEALLQALERLGWPLPQEDISLLEDQITMALSFLQQASDLQEAAKQTSGTRCSDKRTAGPSSRAQGAKPRRALDTLRGRSVLARTEADGFYYPGTVRKRLARKRVIVDFASGDTEFVPLKSLVTVGGAAPCPPLRVGDFVLVGSGTEGTGDCFVPGVVIATPRRLEPSDKLYTVLKYDSRKVHTLRSNIVKISQTRYDLTCHQLRERYGELQRLDRKRRTGSASLQKAADRKSSRTERSKIKWPQEDRDLENRQDSSGHDERDSLGNKSRRSSLTSSSSSQTGSPLSSQTSTPRPEQDSASAKQTPGSRPPDPLAADRMEALAQDLLRALEQHGGQQAEIQRYIRALSPRRLDDDAQDEQRENTNQQQEALEKLQELIPPTAGPASHDHDDPGGIPEYVSTARLHKPKVSPGGNVLARWAHDGWYYYGSVVHACGDQSYFLQNREGVLERVWREDIITEGEDSSQEIKAEDTVIGAHPLYSDRYCPGLVLGLTEDLQIKVRYYDGSEVFTSRGQLFLIPVQKFERDVAYILECEERWVGQLVVARLDHTATYHPAEVRQRVGNGKQYLIRWADGSSAVQDREWIFGKWSRARTLGVGDYALALADPTSHTFLPGVVQGYTGTLLHIHFINGEIQSVEAHHSFGLSEEQFNMAVHLYARQQLCRTEEEEEEEEEEEVEGGNDTEDELDESVYSIDSSSSDL
ncbi:hypothetical protein COCON_G00050310 [Conger conger]|uniref:von Willebrand factor A domain-containing protein 3B n=1 Tax=Conger conger TaxID=82655 RepID=A0A9Q1DVE1_CONCO|nr:hypothetical protein COCON_G00050310 [Conger conger]